MSFRIILAPLFGVDADATAVEAALNVARRFEGHVTALFVRIDPSEAIPLVGEGVSPAIIDQLTRTAEAEMDRRRDTAQSRFTDACERLGVTTADRPPAPGSSAGWLELTGRRDEVVPQKARVSDLTVMTRPDPASETELQPALEATLIGSGRPLLMVPPGRSQGIGHRVAVAWNGRAEAARAVAAALPFIEAAEAVHVLTAETRRTSLDATLELAEYFEWRGIGCERHRVEPRDGSVATGLLHSAREVGADLLVMGGYGRTRLSELVLGGVTRHMFAHADLPVLMIH